MAVFIIHDAEGRVDRATRDELTAYLSTKLTESRKYRVVPERQLKGLLADRKQQSYEACVDETCQIELGKAVAAEKTLMSRILRVNETCAITATLYDLETEAAETAATVRTSCEGKGLLDALDTITTKLADR